MLIGKSITFRNLDYQLVKLLGLQQILETFEGKFISQNP